MDCTNPASGFRQCAQSHGEILLAFKSIVLRMAEDVRLGVVTLAEGRQD